MTVACRMVFRIIKSYGEVSTTFEGLGVGPCRGWKDSRPTPTSSFSEEETIETYGTKAITRNCLNRVDKN